MVNCARGAINNTNDLIKSTLFNYRFSFLARQEQFDSHSSILSDKSPNSSTRLWVRLRQNVIPSGVKFISFGDEKYPNICTPTRGMRGKII